jgi:hypothetical protein
MLINVAISEKRNVIKKVAEKIIKYKKDLIIIIIIIQPMKNVKVKVIPVIIGQIEPSQNHSDNT